MSSAVAPRLFSRVPSRFALAVAAFCAAASSTNRPASSNCHIGGVASVIDPRIAATRSSAVGQGARSAHRSSRTRSTSCTVMHQF